MWTFVGLYGLQLTLATTGITVRMRVEVTALRVDMAYGDFGAKGDVGERVRHAATPECMLEFRAHEAVALTRVGQNEEMNAKHGHVEDGGDQDEADGARHEVLDPESGRDAQVTKEHPELFEGAETDGSNCEEADPFAAHDGTKRETSHGEPDPPGLGERFIVVFVAESRPGEGCEGGEEDEGRVKEDMAGLSDQAVLESNEERCEESGSDATVQSAKSKVSQRDGGNAHEGGDHAHRDIWHVLVYPGVTSVGDAYSEWAGILCDVLEVEVAIIAK